MTLLNVLLALVATYVLSLPAFLGLALVLSLCQLQLATAITAASTARVPADLKGTLVGVEHGTYALAATLGPQLGVRLLSTGGLPALALCGASTAWSLPASPGRKLSLATRSSPVLPQAALVAQPAKYTTALEAATATSGGEAEEGGLLQTLKIGGYFSLW